VLVVGPSFYAASGFGGESRFVSVLRRRLPLALAELTELAYNVFAYRRLARAAASFQADLIYERYNLYYLAGAWLARRLRVPFFVEVNAPLVEERARHGGLRLGALARWAERRVWGAADCVLAVTEVLKQRIVEQSIPSERIRVVPNGVPLERFALPAAAPVASRAPVLGFVGFVRDWHGLDEVIRAMAAPEAPADMVFEIAGEGPARASLEALARSLRVSARVRFLGVVPHEEIPPRVAQFDIALQPRAVDYASPLKIFDYMAAGRAIVAPDQPNIREVLAHERTALLFPPDTPGAMWQAIARLLADPAMRARLGSAARTELEARDYSWRGNATRIVGWAETTRQRRLAMTKGVVPALSEVR
jgi:glycosyltransferase involved in cell wall biosynthesis